MVVSILLANRLHVSAHRYRSCQDYITLTDQSAACIGQQIPIVSRLSHSCWPVSILFLAHSNRKRHVCPVLIDRPVSSQLRESLYEGKASSLTRFNQEADIQGKAFHILRPQQGEVTSLSRTYRSTGCFRIHSKGKPLVGKRACRGRKKKSKEKKSGGILTRLVSTLTKIGWNRSQLYSSGHRTLFCCA